MYTHFVKPQDTSVEVFATQKQTSDQLQRLPLSMKTNDATSDDLVYQPLTGAQEIRVLELHPGRHEGDLDCTLHTCSVEFEYPMDPETQWQPFNLRAISCTTGTPVWYTALSYVWGDPALNL